MIPRTGRFRYSPKTSVPLRWNPSCQSQGAALSCRGGDCRKQHHFSAVPDMGEQNCDVSHTRSCIVNLGFRTTDAYALQEVVPPPRLAEDKKLKGWKPASYLIGLQKGGHESHCYKCDRVRMCVRRCVARHLPTLPSQNRSSRSGVEGSGAPRDGVGRDYGGTCSRTAHRFCQGLL